MTGGRVTTQYWMPVTGDSSIVVDGGELVTGYRNGETDNGRINLGNTANKTVTLTQNGGRIRCSNRTASGNDVEALTLGEASGTSVTVNLNGGELVANGKVHIGYGSTAKAELNVDGGTLSTTHDILIGRNGSGVLTINSGAVNCGTKSTTRWVYLGNNNSTTAGGTLNLNGGVLTAGSVRNGSGTAASTINLNGGILRANATTTLIATNEHLTVAVGAQGAIIDTDGYNSTINQALVSGVTEGTDGGLTKKGAGTLMLTAQPSYSGTTTIEAGALIVTNGFTLGSVVIKPNGLLVVKVEPDETATDLSTLLPNTTFKDESGADASARVLIYTGARRTATDTPTKTYWIGCGNGWWTTAANWSDGVPTAKDTAVFTSSATTYYEADQTYSNLCLTAGVRVRIGPSDVAKYPAAYVQEITGSGTIVLYRSGIRSQSTATQDLVIPETIALEVCNNGSSTGYDSWFKGASASARVIVNGPVEIRNFLVLYENVVLNGAVTVDADAKLKNDKDSSILGDLTVNGTLLTNGGRLTIGASDTTTTLSGSGTVDIPYQATIYANISGPLTIGTRGFSSNNSGHTDLYGNNSGFTGTFTANDYHVPHFYSADSGSAQAVWNINTDMRTKFASGTIHFGTLNLIKGDWYCYYADDATDVIVEVGAHNEDCVFEKDYYCGGKNDKLTFRKVGTGTLSTYLNYYQNLEIKEGVVALKDDHGPSGKFIFTGGTLRYDYASSWDTSARFDFANSTAPISIDTSTNTITLATALAGTHGLVKDGSGTLTLSVKPTYTGDTVVKAGTLIMPYRDDFGGAITIADGASLVMGGGTEPSETTTGTTVCKATGLTVGKDASFMVTGRGTYSNYAFSNGTITADYTAPSSSVTSTWIGGSAGNWSLAANWDHGVPTTSDRAVFNNAATVSFTSVPNVSNIVFNADVTFKNGGGGDKLHILLTEGTGTLTLNQVGIANFSGQSASISNNLNMINGAWFGDHLWEGELSVYGDIVGSGTVAIWGKSGNLNFYGDNSGFTGQITTLSGQGRPVHFCSENSGFSHAEYLDKYNGKLNISITEGTITFGGLTIYSDIAMLDSAKTGAGVTLVIGNDNRDCTFDKSGSAGCDKLTVKKIGTGAFGNSLQSTYNLDLEGGTTTFTADNTATTIGVTNATIKAAADRTLGTVTFGSGSCLAADLAWDTTTADDVVTTNGLKTATLTVTGSTDLGNLIVTLGNTGLTNQVDSAWTKMPTLLTATTALTGTPTLGCAAISNLVAKVADNKLTLAYGTSLSPDETSATTYETESDATAAANAATVQLSSERIEKGQLADYFTNVVTKVSDMSYTVVTQLNEEKVMPTSSAMTSSDSAGSGVTVTANNVKKGLYYKLLSSTDGTTFAGGTSTLAGESSESFTLTNSDEHGTSKVIYYKVQVSDTAQ